MKLNLLDWGIIIVYLLGMILMSTYLGRKQKSIKDYYVGGNNLPWWAIGLSTMATQCSTNSFLGIPALVAIGFGGGLLILQTELALPLSMIFIMLFLLPFFRKANVISVYEYLEKRFDIGTRTLMSILFQISRALATGVTVYSVAVVLKVALGIDTWVSILLIGVVTIIYDTLGGMTAVVYSDVIQMIILYLGVILCIWYGLEIAGGFKEVVKIYTQPQIIVKKEDSKNIKIYDISKKPEKKNLKKQSKKEEKKATVIIKGLKKRFNVILYKIFGLKRGEEFAFWAVLFGFFFLYCSYYGCDQSQVQRELSSKNIDDTNMSLFFNGITRFFLFLSLSLMGLAIGGALLKNLNDPTNNKFILGILENPQNQNQMAIHFILKYLPHGIIGIIIISIFSAAMSSLDSAINSLSATTMRDIYERFIDPSPNEKTHLLWSKMITIGWGIFCTISAFLTPYIGKNVMIAINKVGSLTYGPILATFLLAILTKRANDKGTIIGIIAGVVFNIILWKYTEICWLWWNVIGCIVTFGIGYLASYLFEIPSDEKLKGLIYEPGINKQFNYKINWNIYYFILAGAFFFFISICILIQNIPKYYT